MKTNNNEYNKDYLHRFFGELFEIRIIKNDEFSSTFSGIYENFDKAISECDKFYSNSNIYISINPLMDDCKYKSSYNAMSRAKRNDSIKDKEIKKIKWFYIDIDTKRPISGISSTNNEKEKTFKAVKDVKEYMKSIGFNSPVVCDSGNGYHIHYRIDLENTQENINLIKKCLFSLGERFNNDCIDIDKKVFNASRITKLYGSVARKGLDTEERPHRKSCFIEFPDNVENIINDKKLLLSMSDNLKAGQDKTFINMNNNSIYNNNKYKEFSVSDFLNKHNIGYTEEIKDGWVSYFLDDGCPFNPEHKGKDSCVGQNENGIPFFFCFHNSCSSYTWKDFRKIYEPNYISRNEYIELQNSELKKIISDKYKNISNDIENELLHLKEQDKKEDNKNNTLSYIFTDNEYKDHSKKFKDNYGNYIHPSQERLELVDDKFTPVPLFRTDRGAILKNSVNYLNILRHDNRINKMFRFNIMKNRIENVETGKDWTDIDESMLFNFIELNYGFGRLDMLRIAIDIRKHETCYHPIKEKIDSFIWDGKKRLETVLIDMLGAEDNTYVRAVSKLMFISAVARVYNPGCKYDNMIVFVGSQGGGKSTFIRKMALSDEWYTDGAKTVEGKEAIEQLIGYWICEWGELTAMRRAKDAEGIKLFVSQQEDVYREPYSRHPISLKRQCVFIGSTNNSSFLTDITGNRRFLPVCVKKINNDLMKNKEFSKNFFEQVYSEAVILYKKGFDLFLNDEISLLAEEEQKQFTFEDNRIGVIEEYISKKPFIQYLCVRDVWFDILNQVHEPKRSDSNDIVSLLNNIKFLSKSTSMSTEKYGKQVVWKILPNKLEIDFL